MAKVDEKLMEQMANDFNHYARVVAALLTKKNMDYGPGNIAEFGMHGVLVRLSDKIERLKHLLLNDMTPSNEAIEDTLLDIAGYAIIGRMIQDGRWPTKTYTMKGGDEDVR